MRRRVIPFAGGADRFYKAGPFDLHLATEPFGYQDISSYFVVDARGKMDQTRALHWSQCFA